MERRRVLTESEGEEMIVTGTFIGNGSGAITITHNLGVVPKVFAFLADHNGEASGTMAGVMLNTGISTAYTTTVSKTWLDCGAVFKGDGKADQIKPTSIAYGVASIDENNITINRYGANQNFVQGKEYNWIAISDWR